MLAFWDLRSGFKINVSYSYTVFFISQIPEMDPVPRFVVLNISFLLVTVKKNHCDKLKKMGTPII